MVSSRGTLINKESISKDSINKPATCSQIILANSKESFKVNWLKIGCRNKGTKWVVPKVIFNELLSCSKVI